MSVRWNIPIISPLTFAAWKIDARRKLSWIEDWLSIEDNIIDIGSGPGSLLQVLGTRGFKAVGLDIKDNSYRPELRPYLYGGKDMPFGAKSYDAALLATVLHHTPDPDAILKEAARIASRVIIIEDVYEGRVMDWLTKRMDSLMNLEFFGHPHSNRTDAQWRERFAAMGLTLRHASIYRVGGIFKQAVYVLEVNSPA